MTTNKMLKSGIKLLSETPGTGEPIKKGDTVKVRLNGWLNQGQQIQENYLGRVVVGGREVIPGIDYSIEGMRWGGKRKVKISPHLGYRKAGVENLIPPDAVLVYEIEVLEVKQGN
jgi:FKBP-type peptidyl-prolyl cis-trans isomerase